MIWKSLCIALILVTAAIQTSSASGERYGADFLQQLTSADIDGMGESIATYSIGARSLNNNPAGLAYAEGSELLLNLHRLPRVSAIILKENEDGRWQDHGRYEVEPTEMGVISYALPLNRFGDLGMSFVFHYGGRFIRVDEEGKAVNSFPRDDLAFVLGYSVGLFQGVSLGFDVRSIRSKMPADEGNSIGRTYAMNAGFLHQIGKRSRVGAVLQNIGSRLSFESPDIPDELRRRLIIGAMYVVKDSGKSVLSLSMDINPPFDDGARYNMGAELVYSGFLALRIGYMRSTDPYYEPMISIDDGSSTYEDRTWIRKGPTVGVGLKFKSVELSLASAPSREPILNDDETLRLENHDSILSLSCTAKF